MKVLYYSPHPGISIDSPSGYATHIREVINSMKSNGHEVVILIRGSQSKMDPNKPVPEGPKWKKFVKGIIPSLVWETTKDIRLLLFDRKSQRVLNKVVQEFKPDVIYERAYYSCSSGIKVAIRNDLPLVLEINAPFPQEREYMSGKSLLTWYSRIVEKRWIKHARRIIVVSSALKKYLEKDMPHDKIIVIPNGVNPSNFIPNQAQVIALRQKYKLEDSMVVGFVGSIFPYHGVDILIRSFSNVCKKHSNLKLIVVGDGYMLEDLKTLTATLECKGNIIFTGNVPHEEVFNYISLFDIAVMARSNWYGSPVKIFEYGALAKPMIVPDTIPIRDVIEDQKDALIVNSNEVSMEQALLKLIDSEELRTTLGENFNKKVLSNYTWDITAQVALYNLFLIKSIE